MATETAASPLIGAAELATRLRAPEPPLLLDARTDAAAYAQGHLPGAHHADLETQLSAARDPGADARRDGRHPLPPLARWCRQLGEWGVAPQTDVVVYDDQAGANAAARAWWMLRAVGHRRVQVLDGGYAAALDAGLQPTTQAPASRAQPPYPATQWELPTVNLLQVDRLRSDPQWKLLDVRAAPRYRGDTEPIDPVAGHIPGALNLPFADNLSGGRFKSPDALRAQYRALLGDTPPERLAVHCGSGVTACHTLLALEAAGLPGAALYVGSWSQWCRGDRPRGRVAS
jgi:thiosulfate/3-mercaptopyruvate sulfurtransferase